MSNVSNDRSTMLLMALALAGIFFLCVVCLLFGIVFRDQIGQTVSELFASPTPPPTRTPRPTFTRTPAFTKTPAASPTPVATPTKTKPTAAPQPPAPKATPTPPPPPEPTKPAFQFSGGMTNHFPNCGSTGIKGYVYRDTANMPFLSKVVAIFTGGVKVGCANPTNASGAYDFILDPNHQRAGSWEVAVVDATQAPDGSWGNCEIKAVLSEKVPVQTTIENCCAKGVPSPGDDCTGVQWPEVSFYANW